MESLGASLETEQRSKGEALRIKKKLEGDINKQTDDSKMIEDLANKALATSKEANRLAQDAVQLPEQTSQEIDRLQNEYAEAQALFQTTKVAATNSKKRADETKDNAIKLLTLAKQSLGDADLDMLKDKSEGIKNQAEAIVKQAEMLMKQNEELMKQVMNSSMNGEQLMDEGAKVYQNLDNLLSEANYAHNLAKTAVMQAEKTLREANDTLNTLENYKELTAYKEQAEEAMKKVNEINDTITKAIETTKQAVDALKNVEEEAKV